MFKVYEIGRRDSKAIEQFLSGKKFLMGDKVCNEDASLFGILCQCVYHDRGPLNEYVKNECPNILKYIENIKNTYWPDWNDHVREKEIPKDD